MDGHNESYVKFNQTSNTVDELLVNNHTMSLTSMVERGTTQTLE